MIRRAMSAVALSVVVFVGCFGHGPDPVVAAPMPGERVVVIMPGPTADLEYAVNVVDLGTNRIIFRMGANARTLSQYMPRNRGVGCTMDPCPTLSVVMAAGPSLADGGNAPVPDEVIIAFARDAVSSYWGRMRMLQQQVYY